MTAGSGVGGWWMASDGKWYPPELHPDHAAVPQSPPAADPPATAMATPSTPSTVTGPTRSATPPTVNARPPVTSAGFTGTPLTATPSMPPGARRRSTRYGASRAWPLVVGVVVVILAAVGGVAWFAVDNGRPAPLPKHLPVPPFPTVPAHSGSAASGQSPVSPGAQGATTPSSASTGGVAASPAPAAGQPCTASQAGQSVSGAGGTLVCTKRTVVSDGGGQLPVGYYWEPG